MFRKNECKHPISRACKKAGLRQISWHVLRHTFASHLVLRGAAMKVVQELLGHATIEMTNRNSHLSPEVPRDAVKLVEVTVKNLSAPSCRACGAVLVPGDVLELLSLAIAGFMLSQSDLEPIEVKFLRKVLEYTQAELAEHLGVDRATANRWEQEGGRVTGANSYALRSHVFMQLRDKAGPLFATAEKALKEHSTPRPAVPACCGPNVHGACGGIHSSVVFEKTSQNAEAGSR
jgi:DNA-binding XRE family transcriptional regulator